MARSYFNDTNGMRGDDETTPLLATDTPVSRTNVHPSQASKITSNESSNEDEKPLPKGQIFLLCYLRLVEPIAFFAVFPFINKMIWEIGSVKETDVGFWSGLIVRSRIFILLEQN
jgi:hypothetical protein